MILRGINEKASTLRTGKKTNGKKLGTLGSHWNSQLTSPESVPTTENLICVIAIAVFIFKTLWILFSISSKQAILTETNIKLIIKKSYISALSDPWPRDTFSKVVFSFLVGLITCMFVILWKEMVYMIYKTTMYATKFREKILISYQRPERQNK